MSSNNALKNTVNPNSSVDRQNVYTAPNGAPVVIRYLVLNESGEGDNVQYKSRLAALESVLGDRGIGDELIAEMRSCMVNVRDSLEVSDWISANSDYVLELFEQYKYRLIEVLEWRK